MFFLNKVGVTLKKLILNKYLVVFVSFAVFVTFFDEHNLINRWQTDIKINQLKDELNFYKNEITTTRQKMNELQSNSENLEKFAREHYLMKKDNEEIFIINEE